MEYNGETKCIPIEFSGDGSTIVGKMGNTVYLWAADTKQLQRSQTLESTELIRAFAISQDTKLFASGDYYGNVSVFETDTFKEIGAFHIPERDDYTQNFVVSIKFFPDSTKIIAGSHGGSIVGEISTGEIVYKSISGVGGNDGYHFLEKGTRILHLPDTIYDLKTGVETKLPNGGSSYSPNKEWILKQIMIKEPSKGEVGYQYQAYDINTLEVVQEYNQMDGKARDTQISADGNFVLTRLQDRGIRLQRLEENGVCREIWMFDTPPYLASRFSPDSKHIILYAEEVTSVFKISDLTTGVSGASLFQPEE